jgi:ABC-type uncharacterized transport system auxiliary subunit
VATVALAAKVLNASGNIVGTRTFQHSAAVSEPGAPAAVAALDRAFGELARELVIWTTSLL